MKALTCSCVLVRMFWEWFDNLALGMWEVSITSVKINKNGMKYLELHNNPGNRINLVIKLYIVIVINLDMLV